MSIEKGRVILVAEDEPLIRLDAVEALEVVGYTVIEAQDGAETVAQFYDHLGQIDLVLLDIQMPQLNGYDVLEKIRFVDRDVIVLFLTAVVIDWEQYDVAGIVQKPYRRTELLRAVTTALSSGGQSAVDHT